MNAKLTHTQTAILNAAARRPDGNIEPLPPTLRGGARTKVIEGLLARELITKFHYPDRIEYYLTDSGFAAIGHKRKLPAPTAPNPELEAAVTAAEAKWQADAVTKRDAADALQKVEVGLRPGTVLVREYGEREHRVTALADGGFEYEGRRFKSLSAVARHITGSQWSGPVFFGLVKSQREKK